MCVYMIFYNSQVSLTQRGWDLEFNMEIQHFAKLQERQPELRKIAHAERGLMVGENIVY